MATDKDVLSLNVATSQDALNGKAFPYFDKETGEPGAFDGATLLSGKPSWYGVELYTGSTTAANGDSFTDGQLALIRIGNTDYHKSLPVHSLMKGCLLDDSGNVKEYLSGNWEDHDLTGASGQVMVEVPAHYRKFEYDVWSGSIYRFAVKISLEAFEGATLVPKFYVGAYEASVDSSKLCSVSGVTPKTAVAYKTFRTYARARNSSNTKWNCLPYEQYKTLFWLYYIEYANRNCQAAVNTARDSNGYRQGGLGTGISNISNWAAYNSSYPIVTTGKTNSLGDGSGEVTEDASDYVNNDVTLTTGDGYVHNNRWRGIENPFGHIWKFIDGVKVYANTDDATDRTIYVIDDTDNFVASDSSISGYRNIGKEKGTGIWPKELIYGAKGEIIPGTNCGTGSSSKGWCDYHSCGNTGIRVLLFGGDASYGAYDGLAYSNSLSAPSSSYTHVGARLCFIP